MKAQECRFCEAPLSHLFCDLGSSPIANAYLRSDQLAAMEPFYPLRALVCGECKLVQLEDYETPEAIFTDYAYFSSYSASWLEHSRRYAEAATERLGLGPSSRVIEAASNDGYLLQYFHSAGIPVLGIEPAANVARVAIQKGIPSLVEFLGAAKAEEIAAGGWRADLLIANNVLAHVPDLNDFVAGLRILLAEGGELTIEVPHLLRLIAERQFDTIYHEHFSYFSLASATRVLEAHGLAVHDVERLPTHGGSLRIHASHAGEGRSASERVAELGRLEDEAGLDDLATYDDFSHRVQIAKRELLEVLIGLKGEGAEIAAYGAPAKGNTLLNYCGIGTDFVEFTVDRNPHKQGLHLPGSHIPILAPEEIERRRPGIVFILPWNLTAEITEQLAGVREWGGRFLTRDPDPRLIG